MKIIVLGAGPAGGANGSRPGGRNGLEVTVVDRDEGALNRPQSLANITSVMADLTDPVRVTALVANYNFVVDAVPGFMGFQTCGRSSRPALSDPELIDFDGIGTLEAFNTDGLRTQAHTIGAPNMKGKTLRYPGHIEKMSILRESGFFSEDEIEIRGQKIRPLDVTAQLLFPMWKLEPGQGDITVMPILAKGRKNGQRLRYVY